HFPPHKGEGESGVCDSVLPNMDFPLAASRVTYYQCRTNWRPLMSKHPFKIEICVEGIDGLVAAQSAGADRVELCASLLEGGLTPSLGMVRAALAVATIPFHVIIRPRGGDFLYSELEFQSMLEDGRAMQALGVAGIVIGCLTPEGTIDEQRTKALVQAAHPMKVTNHRAFDMTRDYREAIEALIRCGVDRVLTSGQADTALDGIATLAGS